LHRLRLHLQLGMPLYAQNGGVTFAAQPLDNPVRRVSHGAQPPTQPSDLLVVPGADIERRLSVDLREQPVGVELDGVPGRLSWREPVDDTLPPAIGDV
jgi:hypothetical protein